MTHEEKQNRIAEALTMLHDNSWTDLELEESLDYASDEFVDTILLEIFKCFCRSEHVNGIAEGRSIIEDELLSEDERDMICVLTRFKHFFSGYLEGVVEAYMKNLQAKEEKK
jgi:hypothetical protein